MLGEQLLLLLIDQVHDVVVVSHDEHDVLLEDAELLTSIVELGQVDVQVHETVLGHLRPIVYFDQDLAQLRIEIALK